MPATLAASERRVARRAALAAGRALARAAREAPGHAPPPNPFEFVRALEVASSSPDRPEALRVRPGVSIPFEFVSNLEAASNSISRREAMKIAGRAYRRALRD